jgi:CBS domain-containing protein
MAQTEQRIRQEAVKPGFDKEMLKRVEEGQPGLHGPYGIAAVYNKKLSTFKGKVIYAFAGEDTLGDVLTRLAVGFINGVPVAIRNEQKEITEFLGFVDVLDILAHLLTICGVEASKKGEATTLSEEHLEKIGTLGKEFTKTPIENIVGLSGRNEFATLDENITLGEALPYLQDNHRIAIKNREGQLTGIISQSLIANYLVNNLPRIKFDPRLRNTLEEFPFATRKIMTVNRDTKVIDAFIQMHSMKLSAVGVVDNQGKLCGNLSASDLKGWHLFEPRLRHLLRPVGAFLKHIRKFQFRSGEHVVALNNKNTWGDLLRTFQKNSVHRVYLVDDNFKPAGVISLTDFMKACAPSKATTQTETIKGPASD